MNNFFSQSKIFFLLVAAFYLQACGVKAPPVAPEHKKTIPSNLDCSPYDADCDKKDEHYVPQKKNNKK